MSSLVQNDAPSPVLPTGLGRIIHSGLALIIRKNAANTQQRNFQKVLTFLFNEEQMLLIVLLNTSFCDQSLMLQITVEMLNSHILHQNLSYPSKENKFARSYWVFYSIAEA